MSLHSNKPKTMINYKELTFRYIFESKFGWFARNYVVVAVAIKMVIFITIFKPVFGSGVLFKFAVTL